MTIIGEAHSMGFPILPHYAKYRPVELRPYHWTLAVVFRPKQHLSQFLAKLLRDDEFRAILAVGLVLASQSGEAEMLDVLNWSDERLYGEMGETLPFPKVTKGRLKRLLHLAVFVSLCDNTTKELLGDSTTLMGFPQDFICSLAHEGIVDGVLKLDSTEHHWEALRRILNHCAEEGHVHVLRVLCQYVGANANIVDYVEDDDDDVEGTAMHAASFKGQVNVVHKLADLGANLDFKNSEGDTPLHVACKAQEWLVAEALTKLGSNINMKDGKGSTALHFAARTGKVDFVCMLVDAGADFNLEDGKGLVPLHHAYLKDQHEVVKVLTDFGANVKMTNKSGHEPLCKACKKGHLDLVRMLLESGADVNLTDHQGYAPLHYACEKEYVEIANLLIKNPGIDVNKTLLDETKMTPIMIASDKLNTDIVLSLIKKGTINLLAKDSKQSTALCYCLKSLSMSKLLVIMRKEGATIEMIQKVITNHHQSQFLIASALVTNAKELVNIKDSDAHTPLFEAIYLGNVEMVELFLKHGANIGEDTGAIRKAIEMHSSPVMKLLIDHGLDINQILPNKSKSRLIHQVLEAGSIDVASHLLDSGVNLLVFNSSTKSVLHSAVISGNMHLVQLILNRIGGTSMADLRASWIGAVYEKANNDAEKYLKLNWEDCPIFRRLRFRSYKPEKIQRVFINLPDILGWTALHYAAYAGSSSIVNLLLQYGALPNFFDVTLTTPQMLAERGGFIKIAQTIKAHIDIAKISQHFILQESLSIGLALDYQETFDAHQFRQIIRRVANFYQQCEAATEKKEYCLSNLCFTQAKFNENIEKETWLPNQWKKDGFLSIDGNLLNMALEKCCFLKCNCQYESASSMTYAIKPMARMPSSSFVCPEECKQ